MCFEVFLVVRFYKFSLDSVRIEVFLVGFYNDLKCFEVFRCVFEVL